ncbi:unnamed protein product [Schistocephalus solidus]|uniref:Muscular LMNA-interacting protein n=1 Tax=Schistocephalus solidus TaxID=70667 RepID=A0A183SV22_SCHSO|nr:unnamed protein product [Schistocephalus solidus]
MNFLITTGDQPFAVVAFLITTVHLEGRVTTGLEPLAPSAVTRNPNVLGEESGQVFVPFLLSVGLGSEAILPSCLRSPANQPPPAGDSPMNLTSDPPEQCSHPPGAPPLPLSGGFPQSTTSLNLGPTRPFTNKVSCRGMVVTLKCGGSPQPNFAPSSTIALPKAFSNAAQQLNLVLLTREKKPKIMRIGKRTKEVLFRPEVSEGLTRLICTCKAAPHLAGGSEGVAPVGARLGHSLSLLEPSGASVASPGPSASVVGRSDSVTNSVAGTGNITGSKSLKSSDHPPVSVSKADDISVSSIFSAAQTSENLVIRVCIDGVEWPTTKFFQVSPCWRTHVRIFPLVTISPLDDCLSVANFSLPVANLFSSQFWVTIFAIPFYFSKLAYSSSSSSFFRTLTKRAYLHPMTLKQSYFYKDLTLPHPSSSRSRRLPVKFLL